MIEEVIQVLNTEQKPGAKGPYLEVSYRNEKGEEHKRNVFDQALWDLFGKDLWVKWQLEKERNWWNVKGAESVKEGIFKKEALALVAETAPQEKGMWLKVMGEFIMSGQLEKDFPKSFIKIKSRYYKEMSKKTGISLKGEEETN